MSLEITEIFGQNYGLHSKRNWLCWGLRMLFKMLPCNDSCKFKWGVCFWHLVWYWTFDCRRNRSTSKNFTSLLQFFIYDDASRDTSIKTLQIEFVNSKKSVKVNQSEQLFIPRQKVATGFYSKKSPWWGCHCRNETLCCLKTAGWNIWLG